MINNQFTNNFQAPIFKRIRLIINSLCHLLKIENWSLKIPQAANSLKIDNWKLKISLLAILFFTLTSNAHAASLTKPPNNLGLVGYWSLNEGTGTSATDFSGNGNTGTLTNMATPPTSTSGWGNGKLGGGLNFDGVGDSLPTTNSSSFDFGSGNFSVGWWENRTSNSNGKAAIARHFTTLYSPFVAGYSNGGSNLLIYMSSAGTGWDIASGKSLGPVTLNQWNYFTVVRNGNTFYAYKNGVQTDTWTSALALYAGTGPLLIGGPYSSYSFSGSIDEVRVYSRALSATEITSLYNTGAQRVNASQNLNGSTLTNGLVGYWSFDGRDVSGTTAYDRSGSGNNGTLTNGPVPAIGKIGQGLSFDGVNDYVDLGSADILPSDTSAFSISWWAMNTADAVYTTHFRLKGAGTEFVFAQGGSGLGGRTAYLGFRGYSDRSTSSSLSSQTATLNRWVHRTIVFAGGTINTAGNWTYYENGVVVAMSNWGTVGGSGAANVLGANSGILDLFVGKMDEFRVYRRALSATEITSLYNAGAQKLNSSQNQTKSSLDSGLVGLWSFDGRDVSGTTAYDRSGQGNNGTLTNSPTPAIGKMGQGLSFDGVDDYVSISDSSFPNGSLARSMSFWAYSTRTIGPSGIMGYGTGGNNQLFDSILYSDASHIALHCYSCNSGFDSTSFPVNQWNHVVYVYDGSVNKIYVNGSLADTDSLALNTLRGGTFYIGRGVHTGDGLQNFKGSIDDVRIYNRALSASEVKLLYNMGK